MLAPDQLELLRALERHGVEFVVVGGVAAQVHGWEGATADLDIAISTEDENTTRLDAALASIDAGPPSYGGFGTSFRTIHGRLEIVRRADAIGDYAAWLRNSEKHEIADGVTIAVAAAEDILRSKEAAGRDKDLASLPQMREDFRGSGAL